MALTQVTKSGITADAIDATKIADNAVDSEHIAADSIDAEHYAAGSVDATALGADAVTAAKIGDDVIESEHYAATSIDNEHLADDAVGVAELSATGTASSSTFLRGDNSWTAVSTPITALNSATANELVTVGATTTELDAEANLTFDGTDLTLGTGNIVIGTSGKGIDFSATADNSTTGASTTSELLDDYEEGTFTMAMYAGQNGTITNQTANYTKIGRNVTVNFRGTINDAEGNSVVRVSGFPFGLPAIGIQVTANYSQQQSVGLWISQGGYFYYQNTIVGGNNQGQDAAWLDDETWISFNVTYII